MGGPFLKRMLVGTPHLGRKTTRSTLVCDSMPAWNATGRLARCGLGSVGDRKAVGGDGFRPSEDKALTNTFVAFHGAS